MSHNHKRTRDPSDVLMYGGALVVGLMLILLRNTSPVEASGYVSPFLAFLERQRR